jgi:hypothetical protein
MSAIVFQENRNTLSKTFKLDDLDSHLHLKKIKEKKIYAIESFLPTADGLIH